MLNRRTLSLSIASLAFAGTSSANAQTADVAPFVPNHPLYAPSADLIARRRWEDLVSSVTALPPQSAYTLLTDLGDGSPLGDNLDALIRVRGGAGVGGAILAGWAWRYRGSSAQIANEDAFGRMLVAAAEALVRAQRQDQNDGVSAAFLFRILKGAGEADALHAQLPAYLSSERRPVEGLAAYADAVSAKWLGSENEALAFARRYADLAPAASFGLIADTHITSAVARTMSDDAQVASGAASYFSTQQVIDEIVAAHEHFLAAAADVDQFATLLAHSQFSLAFIQMRDAERARLHLSAQGTFTGGPWRYLETPSVTLARLRASLGLNQT